MTVYIDLMILFVAGSVGLLVAVVLLVIELRLRQQQQQQLREEGIETESNRNANNEIINNPDEQVENIGAGEEENEEDRHRDEQAQQHQQELHARRRRHHINQNIQDRPLYTRSIQRQQDSQTETLEQQHSFDDDTCPICLVQPPTHPCLTNCNHVYCGIYLPFLCSLIFILLVIQIVFYTKGIFRKSKNKAILFIRIEILSNFVPNVYPMLC